MKHRLKMTYVPPVGGEPKIVDLTDLVVVGRIRFMFDLEDEPDTGWAKMHDNETMLKHLLQVIEVESE